MARHADRRRVLLGSNRRSLPPEPVRPNYVRPARSCPRRSSTSADAGPRGAGTTSAPDRGDLLGFSPAEWIDNSSLWLNRLHPEDRDRVIAAEAEAANSIFDGSASEYRMIHRDGRVVWIRDDAVLVTDHTGHARWHGVLSDITEQKLAEDAARAASGATGRCGQARRACAGGCAPGRPDAGGSQFRRPDPRRRGGRGDGARARDGMSRAARGGGLER